MKRKNLNHESWVDEKDIFTEVSQKAVLTARILASEYYITSDTLELDGADWKFEIKRPHGGYFILEMLCDTGLCSYKLDYVAHFISGSNTVSIASQCSVLQSYLPRYLDRDLLVVSLMDRVKLSHRRKDYDVLLEFHIRKDSIESIGKDLALFSSSTPYATDCVLVLDGQQKINVHKGLLSVYSSFFKTMFESNFMEKNQDEIRLSDVLANEFAELLAVIYPTRKPITGD